MAEKKSGKEIPGKQTNPAKSKRVVKRTTRLSSPHIIAVGASAGGLEALQGFLSHLPVFENACIIIAQHLSPTHKSMLVQLLSRETRLKVKEAEHGKKLEAGNIYITPPDTDISILNNTIRLIKPKAAGGPKPSVDVLFGSLAAIKNRKRAGIILSGTGSDGATGVRLLKESKGYVLVQDPETAKYDGMPLASIHTGMVDEVMIPQQMGEAIANYFSGKAPKKLRASKETKEKDIFDQILSALSRRSGSDFSQYKMPTLSRRVEKRMQSLHIHRHDEYLALLEKSPQEIDELFKIILIGVTEFFRDMEAFGILEDCLRKLVARKKKGDSIRIWIPGCSTGEEAYSIAILLDRILAEKSKELPVQIFATDIDERAIAFARKGIYEENALQNIPDDIRQRYFIKREKDYELLKSIRSSVLFSRHDLIKNPPFLKLDLLSCRNLLIYFNAGLQQQVLPIFHYALNQDGYLFLGKSESIGHFADLFSIVDSKNKLFQRKIGSKLHQIKFSAYQAHKQPLSANKHQPKEIQELSLGELVKETLFQGFEHPYVVVNENGEIQEVKGDLRLFLTLSAGSIQVNLFKMLNQELQIELRSVFTKAVREQHNIQSRIRRFTIFDNNYYVRFTVKPLVFQSAAETLYIVIFEKLDIDEFISGRVISGKEDLVSIRILELEEELAATKEQLQAYIEEIETSNEELQSLNEELQSANEELQSGNEELETSNEELQSTNEEIQIAYTELRTIHEELERKEKLLQEMQANTRALLNNNLQAFLLIDNTYRILNNNTRATELFKQLNKRAIQAGDSIIDFFPAGQVEELMEEFKTALGGREYRTEKKIISIEGKELWFEINYTPVVLAKDRIAGISLAMLDITESKQAHIALQTAEQLLSSVFEAAPVGICIVNKQDCLVQVNTIFSQLLDKSAEELNGEPLTQILPGLAKNHAFTNPAKNASAGRVLQQEISIVNRKGKALFLEVASKPIRTPDGSQLKVITIKDISDARQYSDQLRDSELKYHAIVDTAMDGIFLTTANAVIDEVNQSACDMFGYNREEFLQLKEGDFLQYEKGQLKSIQLERKQKGWSKGELTGIRKNGEKFPIEFSSVRFKDSRGENLYATLLKDISIRKRAEREMELLIYNTKESYVLLDKELRILSFNFQFARLYAKYFSKEVMKGDYILDYAQPERKEVLAQLYKRVLSGIAEEAELTIPSPGEGLRSIAMRYQPAVNESGGIIGVFVTGIDITQQRESENRERKMQQLLQQAEAVSNTGSWELDLLNKQMYWSDGVFRMCGYKPQEFEISYEKGLSVIHPDDRARALEQLRVTIESGAEYKIQKRFITRDGAIRQIFSKATLMKDAQGNPVKLVGVFQDITDLLNTQQQIAESEKRYRTLFLQNPVPIWIYDLESLQFLEVNEEAIRKYGYSREEFLQMTIKDIRPPEDIPKLKDIARTEISNASVYQGNWRHILKSGEMIDVEITSHLINYQEKSASLVLALDITEKVRARESLMKANKDLELILQSTDEGIFGIDEAGNCSFANKAAGKLLGYRPEEMIGKNMHALTHHTRRDGSIFPENECPVFFSRDQRQGIVLEDELLWRSDGSCFDARLTCNPIIDDDRSIGAVIAFSDISSQKQMLAELSSMRIKQETIINSTNDLIWSVDHKFNLITANKAFLERIELYSGIRLEPGYDMLDFNAFPKPYIHFWKKLYERALQGEAFTEEVFTPEGENNPALWADIHFSPIRIDDRIMGIACYSRDMTAYKLYEKQILDINTKLETAQQIAQLGYWELDLNRQTLYWSKEVYHIWNADPATFAVNFNSFYESIHPDDRADFDVRQKAAMKGEGVLDYEHRIILPDGSIKYVHEKGSLIFDEKGIPLKFEGTVQDVTERVLAAAGIRDSEEKRKLIMNAALDAIICIDMEGLVTFWNPQAEKIFGWKEEEISGKKLSQFIIPEKHREALDQGVSINKKTSNSKRINKVLELSGMRKSGEEFPIEVAVMHIQQEHDEFLCAFIRDITDRKEFLQKIQESEEKYRNLFDNSPIPKWIYDLETLQILEVNQAATEHYGYTKEAFKRKNLRDLRPAEDIELLESAIRTISKKGKIQFGQWRHIKANGELIYVEVVGNFIPFNGREAMLIAILDITERKEALEKIQESEASLAEAQRLAKMGSWNFDFINDRLTWSEGLYHVFDVNKETFHETHESFLDLVEEADREKVRQTSLHTQETGDSFTIEYRITTPKGEKRVIQEHGYGQKDETGKVIRLFGTAQDITERKNAEEAIKQSNERFEYVTRATFDAIWDWEIEADITYYGEGFKTVFRLDPQLLQNDQYSWDNRIHPEDLQAVLISLQESINDNLRQYWIQEYRFLNGSNEYAYVRDKAIILRDAAGKAIRMIGAMQDITPLKEAEIRLTYERNMMRAIIDNIPDYIYVKDRQYRHIVNNKAMVQLLGCCNEADSLGKTLEAFFPPEVAKQYLDDDAMVIKTEKPVFNREEYTINPKGEKEWILTTKVPLRNETGEVTGLVGITRNVSFIYKQQQEEKLIFEIIAAIGKNESFSIALANTVRLLADSMGFKLGEAWVMNLSETELIRRAFWMNGQTGDPHPFQQSDRMAAGTGLPGNCWNSSEILIWNNLSDSELFLRRDAAEATGLHSAIGIPVQFNNEMIAVLLFMSEKNINDQKDSIRMLQRIALQVGVDLKRKKTEDELNQFFNYAPELLCIAAPDGYFKKVNPAFCKVLGYTEQELLSQPFFNFVHPDDYKNTVTVLKDATGGQMALSFENRYKTKSGEWRWISWSSSAPLDEEGLVFGYGKDVTLSKEAALNLQKFRQVIESSRDGIGIISLTGDEPFMNKAFVDMLEYSPEELNSLESALSIYVDPAMGKEMFDCLYNGQYWKGDIQLRSKSGKIIDFYLSGGPIINEKNEVVAIYGLHTNISERKQLERDLLGYNIKINTILESITDGFFSVDNNWIVTYWNKEAEKILLTPRDTIIGENLWEKFGDAMTLKFYTEYHRAISEGVSVHFEEFFGPLNAWFEVSAYPSANGLSVYFKDVTERKKADEALKLSNERYAIVAQATNDSIWDWNLENNEVYRPGKKLETSWGYESIKAAAVDDFWKNHVHPDDWKALNKRRNAILADPLLTYWDDEYRFVRPDGSYAYVYDRAYILRNDEGKAVRLIGASRDISNEKEQVNEIQRIRQNLEALINTTNDMIWSVDTELKVITCNRAHQSLAGKLTGTQLREGDLGTSGFGDSEAKKWEAYYRRCLKGSQFSVNESFFDPVMGKLNHTIVSFSPMRDIEGTIYGAACYAKDVTDLANSTIQLEELNKKLQKQAAELANSNRELEQFAFVASHDLQEPLRMVSSFLELIDKKYRSLLDETGRQYIRYAVNGAERMKQLIRNLLQYSRLGSAPEEIGDTDMNEVLKQVTDTLKSRIEKLQASIEAGALPILYYTRKSQMIQLIQNLVSNALKYHGKEKPLVKITARDEGDKWLFTISDNGIGIDPRYNEKIFVIFQRLHNNNEYTGTGIGLSTCKKIVELHGGKIWVESEPGNGSTFYFSISKSGTQLH